MKLRRPSPEEIRRGSSRLNASFGGTGRRSLFLSAARWRTVAPFATSSGEVCFSPVSTGTAGSGRSSVRMEEALLLGLGSQRCEARR